MHAETKVRTLLEDWQARRARLADAALPPSPRATSHARSLDYLIRRYQDSPEAAQPARFSPKTPLRVDDRAIVVHDHVWEGKVGGVKTRKQAEERVSGILHRMAADDTGVPGRPDAGLPWFVSEEETYDPLVWHAALRRVQRSRNALPAIEKALNEDSATPSAVARYLYECITGDDENRLIAAELFTRCRGQHVLSYGVLAWRACVQLGKPDRAADTLCKFFCSPDVREDAAQRIRLELANDHSLVRLAALFLIGRIGTLDDVGLLSDLLSLPPADDEHPDERAVLLQSMQCIAEADE